MSAYSTLHITRSRARAFIVGELFIADDRTLERILDILIERRLYNSVIVPDSSTNDDNEL